MILKRIEREKEKNNWETTGELKRGKKNKK